jgi:predicted dehydrogenase
MNSQKLRVAVVGVGSLGQHHARVYSEIEDVELVAIVDTDFNRAKEIALRFQCQAYSQLSGLYGLVDAASVVVPTSAHHDVATTLLEHGIHLLLEKPMTTTLEEADRLIDISERSGAMLQVGHIEQFNAGVRALKTHLNHPRFIECHRINPFVPRGTDVHVILDLMIHDIDIILSLVPSELTEVRASGTGVLTSNIDIANVRLAFENGCVANITASRVSSVKLRKIRIFQPNGYFSLDYAKQEMMIYRRIDQGGAIPEIKVDKIIAEKEESLKAELSSFIQSIRAQSAPMVSGRDGRRALEVALQIVDLIKQHEQSFPK